MAEHMSILTHIQKTYRPRFIFTSKTGRNSLKQIFRLTVTQLFAKTDTADFWAASDIRLGDQELGLRGCVSLRTNWRLEVEHRWDIRPL